MAVTCTVLVRICKFHNICILWRCDVHYFWYSSTQNRGQPLSTL